MIKKISNQLVTALLAILLIPMQSFASSATEPVNPISSSSESVNIEPMINRLNEIKDMDKSNLSPAERKELRKEVRGIKESINQNGGGFYISVGAIIIIVLLLIILL